MHSYKKVNTLPHLSHINKYDCFYLIQSYEAGLRLVNKISLSSIPAPAPIFHPNIIKLIAAKATTRAAAFLTFSWDNRVKKCIPIREPIKTLARPTKK